MAGHASNDKILSSGIGLMHLKCLLKCLTLSVSPDGSAYRRMPSYNSLGSFVQPSRKEFESAMVIASMLHKVGVKDVVDVEDGSTLAKVDKCRS